MIIENGFLVFMGLVLLGFKLPRRTSLIWLGKPLLLDVCVTVLTLLIHWGTFSGVMAASVAGLLTSGFSSTCRWYFGYIEHGVYKPGVITIKLDNKK